MLQSALDFKSEYVIHKGDYKFAEMIGQKPSIAVMSLNLVGHPYIALEK